LALTYDLLVVPGTAFMPDDRRTFRVSISNLDRTAVADLAERLAAAAERAGRRVGC
jgi:DNA-binding transcriptional MocR family regulator